MKVVQISPAYKPAYIYGGPTVSVALLCEALIKRNINLQVLTTTANGQKDFESKEEMTIIDEVNVIYFRRVWKGSVHLSFSLLKYLVIYISKSDILHVHSWWNATAVLSALISITRGNKVIISPRGMLTDYTLNNKKPFLKMLFHRTLGKWILNRCLIHVTTEKEKIDVLNFIGHKNIAVIPNFAAYITEAEANLKHKNKKLSVLKKERAGNTFRSIIICET